MNLLCEKSFKNIRTLFLPMFDNNVLIIDNFDSGLMWTALTVLYTILSCFSRPYEFGSCESLKIIIFRYLGDFLLGDKLMKYIF